MPGNFDAGKSKPVFEKDNFKLAGLSAEGKKYKFDVPHLYSAWLECALLSTDKYTAPTQAQAANFIQAFKKSFNSAASASAQQIDDYTFQNSKGFEVHMSASGSKALIRAFIVKRRLFLITMIYNGDMDDTQFAKTLDTFTLLTPDELVKAKIDEATAGQLPQSPVSAKDRTDAHDENLKGKVKSVNGKRVQGPIRTAYRIITYY
jgi:hypothetical protein